MHAYTVPTQIVTQDLGTRESLAARELPVQKIENAVASVTESTASVVSEEDLFIVKSPIVGTMYSSPNPESQNFVVVGSMVKKGDTLCILEDMKLMNEIESEVDGEVVEVLVSNEDMVEYGQPLFKIRKK